MSNGSEETERERDAEQRRFEHENIRDEQFWFTVTTLGINGFFISSPQQVVHWYVSPIALTLISAYAIFLIGHRHANLTKTIEYPKQMPAVPWRQNLIKTYTHIKIFPSQLWLIICEFSGSFFYILLLLLSLAGVWASAHNTTTPPIPKVSC